MKGLMVTLLITLGAGIAQAQQQYNESRLSNGTARSGASASDSTSRFSARRSDSSRLSPLNPSARVNGPRVAQSSSRGDGFEVTSSQTFGGSRTTEDDRRPATSADDRSRSVLGDSQSTGYSSSNSRPISSDARATSGQRNSYPAGQDPRINNQQTPPPFTLNVNKDTAEQLKANGYLRAIVTPNIQGSVDRIVMFGDQANANEVALSGNVTDNDVRMVNDYVVIDVDDYTLTKIEKGSMNLGDLAGNRFEGVVLRYTGSYGKNMPIQSIPELSSRTTTAVSSRDPFVANNSNYDRGNLDQNNYDRVNPVRRDDQLDLTADRRPVTSDNRGGSWRVNDDLRTPRRRDFDNDDNYDRTRNQDSDRFVSRDNQFENRDRSLGDRYLDEMVRTNRTDSGTPARARDYVLDAIDRSRDRTDQADPRYTNYDPARSPRYQETLEEEARVLRARLAAQARDRELDRQRERELDDKARWVEEQKRLLAQRPASTYPLTPPEYPGRQRYSEDRYAADRYANDRYANDRYPSDLYPSDPNRQQRERLADRSTDPLYGGRPASVTSYGLQQASSATDEWARMLKDKEDTINKKMAAIPHLMKLNATERELDSKIEKIKDENQSSLVGSKHADGRVASYNGDGPVLGTMGGNMASGRRPQPSDRYASNTGGYTSTVSNVRSGGGGLPPLDVNSGGGYTGNYGRDKNYSSEPNDGRMLRFMWLMLLLSLGANFYLAVLSRSFYTRYDELADELRETFTTTNNNY